MNLRLTTGALVGMIACVLLAGYAQEEEPSSTTSSYMPQAVFCPDPTHSDSLCGVMPSMIGPDPTIASTKEGYQGLSNFVKSFDADAQTPFDNMSWQMFVALNKKDSMGDYTWENYTRVEDVFGGAPSPCTNLDNLPLFSITAKSGGQPSDQDEEFLEAATNKPLIDRHGNWTLYERRINDIEKQYLTTWGLTTLKGQQHFIEAGDSVNFTESDTTTAYSTPGAMELKIAWRILEPTQGDTLSKFITTQGLIAVDTALVYASNESICDTVTLGLVGFHILQKTPARGDLNPQWIWATFEPPGQRAVGPPSLRSGRKRLLQQEAPTDV